MRDFFSAEKEKDGMCFFKAYTKRKRPSNEFNCHDGKGFMVRYNWLENCQENDHWCKHFLNNAFDHGVTRAGKEEIYQILFHYKPNPKRLSKRYVEWAKWYCRDDKRKCHHMIFYGLALLNVRILKRSAKMIKDEQVSSKTTWIMGALAVGFIIFAVALLLYFFLFKKEKKSGFCSDRNRMSRMSTGKSRKSHLRGSKIVHSKLSKLSGKRSGKSMGKRKDQLKEKTTSKTKASRLSKKSSARKVALKH